MKFLQRLLMQLQDFWGGHDHSRRRATLLLAVTLFVLILIYLPTLLTQITGGIENNPSQAPYMDDVGEIQVALNVWGTVHQSGYPLYTILGNLTTLVLRGLGAAPAAAACLYAMGWGLIALALFYVLVYHLTGKAAVAAVATLALGLARSIWIHNVIAEVYSMALAFEVALLAIAVWRPITQHSAPRNVQWRIWLLALVGGFGVAHHRTVGLFAPGLLWAVWPGLQTLYRLSKRRLCITLGIALLLGLVGFIPYIYLPARALAGSDWVYGDPGTWSGFWRLFTGAEASFLMQPPANLAAWLDNVADTFRILLTELTPILAVAGSLSLLWAMFASRFKREARIAGACTLGTFAFLFVLHQTVMPQAVTMPIVMILVLGLAFALDGVFTWLNRPRFSVALAGALAICSALLLIPAQWDFIVTMTHSDSGQNMIALAQHVPREGGQSIFMLPWGPRYTAVAFSKLVTQENAGLTLVRDTADFGALSAQGNTIYTAKDTFYQFPLSWWDARLGRAYLASAGDGLVAIRRAPLTQSSDQAKPVGHGVILHNASLCATDKELRLTITWGADSIPDADLSVFVKLLQGDSVLQPQADSAAPVYGNYPTTRWSAGEVVYDNYILPRLPQASAITFGMYQQQASGAFVNYGVTKIPLANVFPCDAAASN